MLRHPTFVCHARSNWIGASRRPLQKFPYKLLLKSPYLNVNTVIIAWYQRQTIPVSYGVLQIADILACNIAFSFARGTQILCKVQSTGREKRRGSSCKSPHVNYTVYRLTWAMVRNLLLQWFIQEAAIFSVWTTHQKIFGRWAWLFTEVRFCCTILRNLIYWFSTWSANLSPSTEVYGVYCTMPFLEKI